MTPDEVAKFDTEHARLLVEITEQNNFTIVHRLDAHILRPLEERN